MRNRDHINSKRKELSGCRQCTNETGTIHLAYPLLRVVPKQILLYLSSAIVSATNSTI